MVSVSIAKGQGLTPALKTYADKAGYDVSSISNQNRSDIIDKLENIQKQREEFNQYFNNLK